jgi:preprotein translocase subunit SecG
MSAIVPNDEDSEEDSNPDYPSNGTVPFLTNTTVVTIFLFFVVFVLIFFSMGLV